MFARSLVVALALSTSVVALACSSSSPDEKKGASSAAMSDCSMSVGGGQCLVSVQNFVRGYGITVGTAPDYDIVDAQGRTCGGDGACQIWVRDIPSQYGWVRTDSPGPYDIAVFPPTDTNPWGHITIVHHADESGVYMVDANDDGKESANNTPHLHTRAADGSRAPYGYYHYTGTKLPSCGGGSAAAPSAGEAPAGASCSGYNDALYCGSNYVNGDPNVLYRCAGGIAYVQENCANGCRSMPDGSDDRCN
jgi:hypothetical protein